ncbi:ribokinase [Sinomonas sp. ASV486]|uniref:ribokinase n=1 Tax=Sinomonas sp. ASV486 TaxID=3051170 RepID=UPI0027DC3EB2|nr:ribokinase [Sinomonas sp. ASV486]MDQ4490082.1 ribokinase [Sinomonas sp. ASV486]
MDSSVVVVGSLNADLVFSAERMPDPGETVAGADFAVHPGGKSANQAVAAARLGARVRLVGAVGDDAHGEMLRASAEAAGVDVSAVRVVAGVPSGVAGITVDARGENSIVIIPGANGMLAPGDIAAARSHSVFEGAAVVCLCLEVPMPTVLAAAQAGRDAGATVILNLSPYAAIPPELAACTDVLLVNAREAGQLLGSGDLEPSSDWTATDWAEAGPAFVRAGFRKVIVTLGARGAVLLDPDPAAAVVSLESTPVVPVDTTGAGDGFTAAVTVRLAAGDSLEDAARYASVAAALATTRPGAQPSYPSAGEVEEKIRHAGRGVERDAGRDAG